MVKRIKFIERIDRTVGSGEAATRSANNPSPRSSLEIRKAQFQKRTLIPNCIVRGPVAVLVYVPKLGAVKVLTNPEKFGWLKRL
jgi:hypothetical protein